MGLVSIVLPALLVLGITNAQTAIGAVACVGAEVAGQWAGNPSDTNTGAWQIKNRNCMISWRTEKPVTRECVFSTYNRIRHVCSGRQMGGELRDDFCGVTVHVEPDLYYIDPDASKSADGSEAASAAAEKRTAPRSHHRDVALRQLDGDTSMVIINILLHAPLKERKVRIAGPLPETSAWTVSNSYSHTTGITAGVEMSASFFEMFTASASLEVSQEFTLGNTVGMNVGIPCNDGILFWQPLYDVYQVVSLPSQRSYDISIPVADSRDSYFVSYPPK